MQGIYHILNLTNNKVYVGQVHKNKGFRRRKIEHLYALRRNQHYNGHLQSSWNKYGEINFDFKFIEDVEDENKLNEREQWWIDRCWDYSYNIQPTAGGSCLGKKHSELTKRKISEANRSRRWTKLSKHRSSVSQKSRFKSSPIDKKTKVKMSNAHKGKTHTEQTKNKISKANIGKKISEETKQKIRLAKLGNAPSKESIIKRRATMALKKYNHSRSRHKGIHYHHGTWVVRISHNGKTHYLGRFNSEVEAAQNFDYHAIQLFGHNATHINFPHYNYQSFTPKKKIKI